MNNPKENVLDRIGQSFMLFFNNFLKLIFSLFIYQILTTIIIFNIISYIFFTSFFNISNLNNYNINNIFDIFMNPNVIMYISFMFLLWSIYLILIIPFLLATIKSIKQAYNWENITSQDNVLYWFKNLWNSFKTYWYIFAYIALIPSIIIIIWWFLLIYSLINHIETSSWLIIIFVWVILLMIFGITRWIKTIFSLYSAVDKNEFTKENFNFSVSTTNNNWWRIVWNFILIWIIISLISSSFSQIIWIIWLIGSKTNFSDILKINDINALDSNISVINTYINTYLSSLWKIDKFTIIIDTLNQIINIIWTVFSYIFLYIFFKRLELETNKDIVLRIPPPLGTPFEKGRNL